MPKFNVETTKRLLAYLQFAYAHSAALVGVLGAVILLLEGRNPEGLAALMAALAALADPKKPEAAATPAA